MNVNFIMYEHSIYNMKLNQIIINYSVMVFTLHRIITINYNNYFVTLNVDKNVIIYL